MRRTFLPAALAAALALAACDVQGSPSAAPSPSDAGPTPAGSVDISAGGIVGVVRDPEGTPLANVLVTMETQGFYGTTFTTEDGEFSAPGVAGDFSITVSDLGYTAAVKQVSVPPGELVEVEMVIAPVE